MALRSARARGREGCFESPLPTSGLHSPRNELRLLALNNSEEVGSKQKCWRFVHSHEDLLTAFSLSADLLLRSRLYALAERKVLLKRNTIGGAVNRRSPKNAFSEAASIFGLRQLLRGLKGASSPFLVDPARRNRWCFLVLFWHAKENLTSRNRALPRATGARTHSKNFTFSSATSSDRRRR